MKLNDEERRQWVSNDEGLWLWFRSTRLPMTRFIRENRTEIDDAIRPILEGTKPAHHLAYPARVY